MKGAVGRGTCHECESTVEGEKSPEAVEKAFQVRLLLGVHVGQIELTKPERKVDAKVLPPEHHRGETGCKR